MNTTPIRTARTTSPALVTAAISGATILVFVVAALVVGLFLSATTPQGDDWRALTIILGAAICGAACAAVMYWIVGTIVLVRATEPGERFWVVTSFVLAPVVMYAVVALLPGSPLGILIVAIPTLLVALVSNFGEMS